MLKTVLQNLQMDHTGITALISGITENDALYRSILDGLTIHKDRHIELRLKELSQVFLFQ